MIVTELCFFKSNMKNTSVVSNKNYWRHFILSNTWLNENANVYMKNNAYGQVNHNIPGFLTLIVGIYRLAYFSSPTIIYGWMSKHNYQM